LQSEVAHVFVGKDFDPIDFSERYLGATRYAIPLAERFDSEINLLHVLPPPYEGFRENDMDGATIGEITAARRANVQKQLDDFLNAALHHLRVKRHPRHYALPPLESTLISWSLDEA